MGTLTGVTVDHAHNPTKPRTSAAESEYIGVTELARRLSISPKTIYNHISSGKLGRAQGCRRFGSRVIFHWPSVCQAIERGDI